MEGWELEGGDQEADCRKDEGREEQKKLLDGGPFRGQEETRCQGKPQDPSRMTTAKTPNSRGEGAGTGHPL